MTEDLLHRKLAVLRSGIQSLGRLAVAFSGGVDSTFLLFVAHDVLGDGVIAVTASPAFVPQREKKEADRFCRENGIRQIVIPSENLLLDEARKNPPERCYICKKELFGKIIATAREHGIRAVAEGSNTDDIGDYRPGMRAIRELGVLSPLLDAGLTKVEIRTLSRELGLPTWDKPSSACLASRFAYGEVITDERLRAIEQSEQLLLDLGFRQMRVRVHGTLARIELLPDDFGRFMEEPIRSKVSSALRQFGFQYITLDLTGYRTGSMNEALGAVGTES